VPAHVGALEEKFFRTLLANLGLADDPAFAGDHLDRVAWRRMRAALAEAFRMRTRDEWHARLKDSASCVAPVLSLSEAPEDEHNFARGVFCDVGGQVHPAPAPRFSSPRPAIRGPRPRSGRTTSQQLLFELVRGRHRTNYVALKV
jgi:alpha-methylacyl-CoA racemase